MKNNLLICKSCLEDHKNISIIDKDPIIIYNTRSAEDGLGIILIHSFKCKICGEFEEIKDNL